MTLPDDKFQLIEAKIESIQERIDRGLSGPCSTTLLISALREARVGLFGLRSLIRDVVELDPDRRTSPSTASTPGPDSPEAA